MTNPYQPGDAEAGPSEFSWGKGMMPPLNLNPAPRQSDILRAERRTDPADAGSTANYDEDIRE